MFNFKFPWTRVREARKAAEAAKAAAAAPAPAPGLRAVSGWIAPAPRSARSSTGLASRSSSTSSAPPAPSDDSWMYAAALYGSSAPASSDSTTSSGSDWASAPVVPAAIPAPAAARTAVADPGTEQ